MTEQVRRASRLVEIDNLLRSSRNGLTVRELADKLGYSARTIQRDLNVLEAELGMALVPGEGRRWKVMPGSTPIGAVRFNLQEARAVYFATRLLLRHADEPDPDAYTALDKLAAALPGPLMQQARRTAALLVERPASKGQVEILRTLTEAWATSETVTVSYRSQQAKDARETKLDPYLLEPSTTGAAVYAIGFSHAHGEVRTFKLDRILSADRTGETFVAPPIDTLLEQMNQSWGVVFGDDQYDIAVEFSPAVARRIAESWWHPSQRLIPQEDGALLLELRLPSLLEFIPWVRSWGPEARVIAPDSLRAEVAQSLRAAADQYT